MHLILNDLADRPARQPLTEDLAVPPDGGTIERQRRGGTS